MSRRGRHRARRDRRWPVAPLLSVLVVAVVAAATLAMTTATAAPHARPTGIAESTASATVVPSTAHGRAGHEVTILGLIPPPTAPGCGHLHVLGGNTYRLAGAWRITIPDADGPASTIGQWWWLTGHPLPEIEAADHAVLAPITPGCDHAIAFYVDNATNLSGLLNELWRALLAGPNPATPRPGAVFAPNPRGVAQL